jgi:NADH-quinone oxidoreductase subunit F
LAGELVIDGIDTVLFKDIDEPGLNTIDVYQRRGGYEMLRKALQMEPGAVLDEMLASNVRGRGGAGFAMGRKMSFIPRGAMDKYLVCNADESEPGTFKDRELMQKNPHQLIEGIIIGAFCIGANKAFIYIRGEYRHQADILEAAVGEARAAGFLGERILGSDHTLDLVVHRGAGAYICGEETALLDSLEGKRGNPRLKPPFPAVQGLYQGPTLINNVETLMNVPYILRVGGEEFAKVGTATSTGTKLISISGQVKRPGNYEIILGTPVRDILFGLAGGPLDGRTFKAFFPGGSSAPVLPLTDEVLDLGYDFDTIAKAGSMLGSGAIIVFDDTASIVDVAYKTAHFYRHESCGKCSPCREGTNWTEKMLKRIKDGMGTPMDLDIIDGVCDQILGNCLCVLGDAMAMPVASMIKHFRGEFEAYMETAREGAGLGAAIPQVNRGRQAGPQPMLAPAGVDPVPVSY